MTNYEANKEAIMSIIINHCGIDKNTNKLCKCPDMSCANCVWNKKCFTVKGKEEMRKWLESEESKVDWSKVAPDTPILVRNWDDTWLRRYFAYYKDNLVYTYGNGTTSWSSSGEVYPWDEAKLANIGE